MDPQRALGPPDGRTVAIGRGSYIILRFYQDITLDGSDQTPDLRVYEIGEDASEARVAVGNGEHFIELTTNASGPISDFDLDGLGLSNIFLVRIRGIDNKCESDSPCEAGFDLDAVEALH